MSQVLMSLEKVKMSEKQNTLSIICFMREKGGEDFTMRNDVMKCTNILQWQSLVKKYMLYYNVKKYGSPSCKEAH
jgi:hypothetical protein